MIDSLPMDICDLPGGSVVTVNGDTGGLACGDATCEKPGEKLIPSWVSPKDHDEYVGKTAGNYTTSWASPRSKRARVKLKPHTGASPNNITPISAPPRAHRKSP